MSDIKINVNRLTDVHEQIERARAKLIAAKPAITADTTGSPALAAFVQRVNELDELVGLYAARVEADSRLLYQICTSFMDMDDALAQAYASRVGQRLNAGGRTDGI